MDDKRYSRVLKKIFIIALSTYISVSSVYVQATGKNGESAEDSRDLFQSSETEKSDKSYEEYIKGFCGAARPLTSVTVEGGKAILNDTLAKANIVNEYENRKNVLLWTNDEGSVSFNFTVEQTGLYSIKMEYYILNDDNRSVELECAVDGKIPFSESSRLVLPRYYTNKNQITQDKRGNDLRPAQIAFRSYINASFWDKEGLESEPYAYYFSKGNHVITLIGTKVSSAISSITIFNEEEPATYDDYSAAITKTSEKGSYKIEAESAALKSDSTLYPVYDRSNPDTSPYDPIDLKLNTIGQSNYKNQGQFLIWDVNVEEAGYYKIGIRFRQNIQRGITSYRRLYINDKVPFKEAEEIAFPFSERWQETVLGQTNGEKDGWWFYLEKGENRLKLEVVFGNVSRVNRNLQDIVSEANTLYRKIIMITGTSPDANRDYQLDKEIPGFTDILKNMREKCKTIIEQISEFGDISKSERASSLNELYLQINSFIENTDTIAKRLSHYKSNVSSVSDFVMDLKTAPLELDYISVSGNGTYFDKHKTWYRKLGDKLKAFLGSFTENYASVGDVYESNKAVNVWVNTGRDQLQSLKMIVDSDFVNQTGIPVNVYLVQQSLVQASLSGQSPDVVLFVGQGDPVNLAARHALQNFDEYEDFKEVAGYFGEHSLTPYYYQNHVYAIPLQESFYMMFYRTDIFDEMKLKAPKTWEEFYNVCRVLQRNNMTAGIPNMPPDSQMSANTSMFAMLMKQRNAEYFKKDLSATNFNCIEAIDAFEQWTSTYYEYGLPVQFDFYNRFRTGEMPIGISSYTLYNQLTIAASEIAGDWEMVPIPGIKQDDGMINNCSVASGNCAIMFGNSDNKDNSWKFIKWFAGEKAQKAYGLEIESLLGEAGRYDTANRQAFYGLPWSSKEQSKIMQQWENTFLLPQVVGGYYIDRDLTNAFRKVVYKGKNPRDSLIEYNKDINNEISRKRKEFGLDQ